MSTAVPSQWTAEDFSTRCGHEVTPHLRHGSHYTALFDFVTVHNVSGVELPDNRLYLGDRHEAQV